MKCLKEKKRDLTLLLNLELLMNGENKQKVMKKESSFKITKKEYLMESLKDSRLK